MSKCGKSTSWPDSQTSDVDLESFASSTFSEGRRTREGAVNDLGRLRIRLAVCLPPFWLAAFSLSPQ